MIAVLLALLTALTYGVANYLGPLLNRRLPLGGVLVVGQTASLVGALVLVAVRGGSTDRTGLWLGLAAGVLNGLALASFYTAAARGPISIVAPIGSTGAVVPVVVSMLQGERPSLLQLIGIPIAIAGVALAAARAAPQPDADPVAGVGLSIFAAAAFGAFLAVFAEASHHGATAAVLSSRISLLACTIAVVAAARLTWRVPRADIPSAALPGVLLVIGTAAYGIATTKGLVSIVAVLATLSPVVTVALAVVLLHERVIGRQRAGVAIALAGVVLLAAG
ncbi:MAG: EamA family transporter [Frankiaceae bacterium]|nr:EamA family transporter [Frankiaceae bacterium]